MHILTAHIPFRPDKRESEATPKFNSFKMTIHDT